MKISKKLKRWLFKKIAQRQYHKELNPKSIKKVLIIREGGIGDAVCTYPLLRELKRAYPQYEIDVFASLNNHFMYKHTPYVNKVYIKYKKRQWYKTWLQILKMRSTRYDLILDNTVIRFHRSLYTLIINPTWAIASLGDLKTYGFDRSSLSLYYKTYSTTEIEHIIDMRLKVLKLLNIQNSNNNLEFFLPKNENPQLKEFLKNFTQHTIIGLNTDGSHPSRTLQDQQIVTIAQNLEHKNAQILLFCLPNKRTSFEKLIKEQKLTNVILSYETKSIYDAAELINHLDVLITPDTSFVHIASGLNIPIVGLFWNNPIKTIIWGPKSDKFQLLIPEDPNDNSIANIDLKHISDTCFELIQRK